jgi:hypothetical protein
MQALFFLFSQMAYVQTLHNGLFQLLQALFREMAGLERDVDEKGVEGIG